MFSFAAVGLGVIVGNHGNTPDYWGRICHSQMSPLAFHIHTKKKKAIKPIKRKKVKNKKNCMKVQGKTGFNLKVD